MDFDAALDAIAGVDGEGLDLGGAAPSYPDFPEAEHRRRYARLQALMEREGLDAVVLAQEESVRYFSGYASVIWIAARWLPTVLVATHDPRGAVLVNSLFDGGAARGTSWVAAIDGYARPEEIPAKVRAALGGSARAGLELGVGTTIALPWTIAREVVDACGGDDAVDASGVVSSVRMLKSPAELERVRGAVGAAVAGYGTALAEAQAGATERALAARIASVMYENGATTGLRPVFLNIVSGPERYALLDSFPSDRTLRDGDVIFVDGGCPRDGYMSDLIRTAVVGKTTQESERFAAAAVGATATMAEAARPGLRASELFAAGLEAFREAGVDDVAGSLFGHGIGLEVWERPLVMRHDDPAEDVTLRSGMVLCIEPILAPPAPDGGLAGIYVFEDMIAIEESGAEVLSSGLRRELTRIPS